MAMARDWRRIQPLGQGSTSTVSLAVDSSSGELFAVKSSNLPCAAGILKWEQSIHSTLCSPFVVSYLGFDAAAEGGYSLFIEYAPGGSLADEIKQHGGRLPEAAIRRRAYEVLRGISYLHENGIVHCDVKSQNVLISSDGRAKIADLGCAKLVKFSGEFSGTPMFMAPEVARGEEQGMPADVWALGCAVVEMATGELPWSGFSDAFSVLHHIGFSSQVPKSPEWMSEEGKDFLAKCLIRDPNERWTADQLLQHPFLNFQPNSCANGNWVSPKSTLDHEFWSSFSSEEEEEEEEEEDEELPSKRLRDLSGDGEFVEPNWIWDENWVMVRSNGGASTSREEELFMFSTNHMDSEDFQYTSHDYSFVSESNCEDRVEGQLLLRFGSEFNSCKCDKKSNMRSEESYPSWIFYLCCLLISIINNGLVSLVRWRVSMN